MILKLKKIIKKKRFFEVDYLEPLSKKEERKIKKRFNKLRKAKILKHIPLEKWSKKELLDLIDMYFIYILVTSALNDYKKIETIYGYIKNGKYENYSKFEKYRRGK